MPRTNKTYERIRQLIETKGRPQSLDAIRKAIPDRGDRAISEAIAQAVGRREGHTQTLYIIRYKPQRGKGGVPQPVIAIGVKPNAEMPKTNRYEIEKRYRDQPKNYERILANNRRARRKKTAAKNQGVMAFRALATPPAPVKLAAVVAVRHQLQDDEPDLPEHRRYHRKAA
jgi:hypothetical protein